MEHRQRVSVRLDQLRLMRRNNHTIGLDLGDRRHPVCVLDGSGKIVAEEVIPIARETLLVLSARFPRATFIMETGTHSPLGEPIFAGRTTTGGGGQRAQAPRDLLVDPPTFVGGPNVMAFEPLGTSTPRIF